MAQDVYFANEDGDDLSEELYRRVVDFYHRGSKTIAWQRWIAGWATFSGMPTPESPFDVTELTYSGAEGERANLQVNHLGALGRHMSQLVTQTRPAFDLVAVNDDFASEAQTQIAKGVLNFVKTEEGLEKKFDMATDIAVACGMSWQSALWNVMAGPVYQVDPETKTPLHEGKFESNVYHPWDVITDLHRKDASHIWAITHDRVNKWDLAAQYQTKAEDILDVKATSEERFLAQASQETHASTDVPSDLVSVFTFYHVPTPACPEGRWAVLLNAKVLLADGPLPFDVLPLVRHSAGELLNTQWGDSPFLHGVSLQTLINELVSAVAGNNINAARSTTVIPEGASYTPSDLADGHSVLTVPIGTDGKMMEPKAFNLVASSPETYKLISELVQTLAVLTGVQSSLSGSDPNLAGKLSGAAQVLLESQSLRFLSGLAASYTHLIEGIGTRLMKCLQTYSKSDKIARIAGKTKKFMLKEFNGSMFEGFDRVEVQQGNPGMNTTAFRISIGDSLLQKGAITKEEYFELLATGNLEPVTERQTTKALMVRKENEMLLGGQKPAALMTDPHKLHIDEHASVLDDPEARMDPQLVQNVLAHIQEHVALLKSTDPALLQLLDEQSLAPPPMPPGAAPPPGPAPGQLARMPGPGRLPGSPRMPVNMAQGGRPPLPPGSSGAVPVHRFPQK